MRERKCELLGKRANRQCRLVSFSHIRTKKSQGVNLHEKRVWWAEGAGRQHTSTLHPCIHLPSVSAHRCCF